MPRAGFPTRWYRRVLAIIALLTFLPMIVSWIGSLAAAASGCTIIPGRHTPCVVAGIDLQSVTEIWGGMLLTLPLGGVAALIWLFVLLTHLSAVRGQP